MTDTLFKYPLDLAVNGVYNPNNKVINEAHTIGSRNGRIFVSDYGPFYGLSAVIVDAVTGKPLVPKVDYNLIHLYKEAVQASGQSVYAAVQIINQDVSTSILFTAQVVGGEFSFSTYAIKAAVEALANDNRAIAWGDLVGVPSQFVPAPHLHDAYDLYGLKSLVESNADVAAAIRDGDAASRQLLIEQIGDKFDDFDDFAMQLANCFETGAAELAAL